MKSRKRNSGGKRRTRRGGKRRTRISGGYNANLMKTGGASLEGKKIYIDEDEYDAMPYVVETLTLLNGIKFVKNIHTFNLFDKDSNSLKTLSGMKTLFERPNRPIVGRRRSGYKLKEDFREEKYKNLRESIMYFTAIPLPFMTDEIYNHMKLCTKNNENECINIHLHTPDYFQEMTNPLDDNISTEGEYIMKTGGQGVLSMSGLEKIISKVDNKYKLSKNLDWVVKQDLTFYYILSIFAFVHSYNEIQAQKII